MSTIFSYEIDERNLRVQLKNLEIPLKEEAWQKFDSYARTHGQPEQSPVFQQLQFRLNRNVVMPAIFGTIILVFSLMLYNFVSIKKDKIHNTEAVIAPASEMAAEIPPADAPAAQPASPQIEKIQVIEKPVVEKPVIETALAEIPAPKVSEPVEEPKTVTAPENTVERTVNTEKNRQRKLDKATLSAIKPSVITEEEAEAEIPQ